MVDESITQLLLDASAGKQEASRRQLTNFFRSFMQKCGAFLRPIFAGSAPAIRLKVQRLHERTSL